MSITKSTAPSSNRRLLDHFYGVFVLACVVLLIVGVPFVFHRKTVAAIVTISLLISVLLAWHISRRGRPELSLVMFSAGLWVILVGLIFGGLPPITIATALSISVMLAVVVNLRAGLVFSLSYMLAWLLYIGLGSAQLAPVPYFIGSPLTSWLLAASSVWLVLLPIPELIRKLRASASLQHAVIEATTDGILVVNQLGKVEIFNQRFIEIWGIDPELRRTLDDGVLLNFVEQQLLHPQDFLQKVQELYAHPDRASFDVLHFKDGRIVERNSQPQRLDEQIVGRVWSFRDVTSSEQAQIALRQSHEQFQAILNATTESIFLVDAAGIILSINATAAHRIAHEPEQLIGRCVFDFFSPEVARTRRAALEEVFRSARVKYTEDTRGELSFSLNYYPVLDDAGAVNSVVVFAANITERQRAESLLRAREARLSSLMAAMQDTVLVLDGQAHVVEYFSPQDLQHPSIQASDGVVIGKALTDLLPETAAQAFTAAISALQLVGTAQTIDYSTQEAGQDHFFVATISRIADASGYLIMVRDVTARRVARLEIERLGQRNKLLLESVGEGIFDVNAQGKTTFANPAALSMLGLTEQQILEHDQHTLFHHHHQDGRSYVADESPINQALQDGRRRELDCEWFWRQDGSGFAVSLIVTPIIEEGHQVGVVVVFQDITERKRAEFEIHRLAFHDPLTLLPNRRLLNDRLAQMMVHSKRSGRLGALLFLDLDNFKPLNDAHGHAVGDLLLVEVARRLTQCVREMDTVARFGGDEFVVILSKLDADLGATQQHVQRIAEKIRACLAQPYLLSVPQDDGLITQVEHRCTSSIGVALYPQPDLSAQEVLQRADAAMYRAKDLGGDQVNFD
jgi:diguanylate cyclase (GGDEF)-like protein/PAS domain S-box-containing protein